jgi:hypothetical protein
MIITTDVGKGYTGWWWCILVERSITPTGATYKRIVAWGAGYKSASKACTKMAQWYKRVEKGETMPVPCNNPDVLLRRKSV